jgi:hypothetical protein
LHYFANYFCLHHLHLLHRGAVALQLHIAPSCINSWGVPFRGNPADAAVQEQMGCGDAGSETFTP